MIFEPLGNGDLVEIDADTVSALARVRAIDGARLHVAIERGGYVPWVDTVQVRRFGDAPESGRTARLLHAGNTTAWLELEPLLPPCEVSAALAEIDAGW
jgi:hypothetical protein